MQLTPKQIHELGASAIAVLAALSKNPGAKAVALAMECGIGNHAVYSALKKLKSKGLLPPGSAYSPYGGRKNT